MRRPHRVAAVRSRCAREVAHVTTRRLVLATRNEHKVHELRQILADLVDELGLEIVSAAEVGGPDIPETEVTFEGNGPTCGCCWSRWPTWGRSTGRRPSCARQFSPSRTGPSTRRRAEYTGPWP